MIRTVGVDEKVRLNCKELLKKELKNAAFQDSVQKSKACTAVVDLDSNKVMLFFELETATPEHFMVTSGITDCSFADMLVALTKLNPDYGVIRTML